MKTQEEILRALENCTGVISNCSCCLYLTVGCKKALLRDVRSILLSLVQNDEVGNVPCTEPDPWTRQRVLKEAEKCVCGGREQDYGTPENSFTMIADLWTAYVSNNSIVDTVFSAADVAAMMALLKIARLSTSPQHMDSWVDIAGYAACGGEIAGKDVHG